MHAKGVDTAPLSRPVVLIGDAMKELTQALATAETQLESLTIF